MRRRATTALVLVVVIVLTAAGLVTGIVQRAGRSVLYGTGLWQNGGESSLPSPGEPSSAGAVVAPPVLDVPGHGRAPDAQTLAARIKRVATGGMRGHLSAVVEDEQGRPLFNANGDTGAIPASTMKVLTTSAALTVLGGDHRFATTVTAKLPAHADPARAVPVTLVGGGDPYLCNRRDCAPASATLSDLADQTATSLRQAGVTKITLGYDDSLFTGPAWNPTWPSAYADQVTPVSALVVDQGRLLGYSPGPRETAPAAAARTSFAKRLSDRGITVTPAGRRRSERGATRLGVVESQPLAVIAQQILVHSDNDGAEILFRHLGRAAGGAASFTGGRKALVAMVAKLDPGDGVRSLDGSGLSRDNRVSAATLVALLRLAEDDAHPELRAVATGLPVAAVDGSLAARFVEPGTEAGRGLVRAKTGTLRGTHALAGYVLTTDGALVTFAFLVNDAKDDYAARVWLDRVSSVVAGCGC